MGRSEGVVGSEHEAHFGTHAVVLRGQRQGSGYGLHLNYGTYRFGDAETSEECGFE